MSNVRDIEKIIDEAHKEHAILKLHKKQAIHDILATFEDMCSLVFMGSMLARVDDTVFFLGLRVVFAVFVIEALSVQFVVSAVDVRQLM